MSKYYINTTHSSKLTKQSVSYEEEGVGVVQVEAVGTERGEGVDVVQSCVDGQTNCPHQDKVEGSAGSCEPVLTLNSTERHLYQYLQLLTY